MIKLDIKQLVDNKYKNLNQFAKAINISYPAAKKLYDGDTSRIEFDTLENICNALDCTPNDIFSLTGEPTNNKIIKDYHTTPKMSDFYAHKKETNSLDLQAIILRAMEKALKEMLENPSIINTPKDSDTSDSNE